MQHRWKPDIRFHHRLLPVALLALILTLITPLALAASPTLPDSTIKALVEHRLDKRDLSDTVQVQVENAEVTLTGTVDNLAERQQAVRVAHKVDDVTVVEDRLRLSTMRPDAAIAQDVQEVLDSYILHGVFDWVEAVVEDGKVLLRGDVYAAWHKDALKNRVARIEGVQAVENQIDSLPVSVGDDQLRVQTARAIYGDLTFNHYADMGQPPIHIVVEQGDVTLEGWVRTKVEKALAGSLVRSETMAFDVTNNLRISSDRETSS